jgi:hypothetical protein
MERVTSRAMAGCDRFLAALHSAGSSADRRAGLWMIGASADPFLSLLVTQLLQLRDEVGHARVVDATPSSLLRMRGTFAI